MVKKFIISALIILLDLSGAAASPQIILELNNLMDKYNNARTPGEMEAANKRIREICNEMGADVAARVASSGAHSGEAKQFFTKMKKYAEMGLCASESLEDVFGITYVAARHNSDIKATVENSDGSVSTTTKKVETDYNQPISKEECERLRQEIEQSTLPINMIMTKYQTIERRCRNQHGIYILD